MAIFKCKMCGGSLEIDEGMTVCECEYCGTQQTLPKNHDDVLTNNFNRANNLRMKSEFDKAQEIYEKIVGNNPTEAEAYWGIVLCKYGIEYVEDPATLKKIPTCHRTQLESVMTDVDYQSAIENADAVQRGVYEREAEAIDKLQKDILAIVHKEQPFDVFICYKDMDAYDLPEEFSHLQAQDMGKIGFINDVIRGIKKVIVKDEPKAETIVKETVVQTANAATAPLLKRAALFLEDGDWSSAAEYCNKVLDQDPECAQAYFYLLLADCKIHSEEELPRTELKDGFENSDYFKKALRFSDEEYIVFQLVKIQLA